MKINPELLKTEPSHLFNGNPVKLFLSTKSGNTVTGEIMEGEHKGKWTTVYLDKAVEVCFWDDSRFGMCRQCREHYM